MYLPHIPMVLAGQYYICATEAILDNCFTGQALYSLPCFLTLPSLWKKIRIPEKEGDLVILTMAF